MSKKIKAMTVTLGASIVLFSGTIAVAAKSGIFDTPKQILINAEEHLNVHSQYNGSLTMFSIKLDHLSYTRHYDPMTAFALKQINGATLSTKVALLPIHKLGQIEFSLKTSSGTYPGNVWVDKNNVVANLTRFQPLWDKLILSNQSVNRPQTVTGQTYGYSVNLKKYIPLLPTYLYTGPKYVKQIEGLWIPITPQQLKVIKDFTKWAIQSLPNQNIRRVGLNKIEITFNEHQLITIMDDLINNVYQHKSTAIKDVNSISSRGQYITTFMPKSQFINRFNSLFRTQSFLLDQTKIILSKNSDGYITYTFQTGFSVDDVKDGFKAHFSITMGSLDPNKIAIRMPTLNSHNSNTFEGFFSNASKK